MWSRELWRQPEVETLVEKTGSHFIPVTRRAWQRFSHLSRQSHKKPISSPWEQNWLIGMWNTALGNGMFREKPFDPS
jgi:hypothetical protein